MLINCLKGLAAITTIVVSPVFLVFAPSFGYGLGNDLLNVVGTPAALAVTTGVCLAALSWARWRVSRAPMPRRRLVKSRGSIPHPYSAQPGGGFQHEGQYGHSD